MQGTPVQPTYRPAIRPNSGVSAQKQPRFRQPDERLTLTVRNPGESWAGLQKRAQLKTDAVFLNAQTPRSRRFNTLAQKQGNQFVLPDFTLKPSGFRAKLPYLAKQLPVKVKDVQAGQILIHQRTGKAIKVTDAITRQFNADNKRANVQGKVIKTAAGQLKLKPTHVRTGYLFQFEGVILNPKSGSKA